MSRLCQAAQQLITEVQELKQAAMAGPASPPDEEGVHWTIAFDPLTAQWLKPAMEASDDPRVARMELDGQLLVVTFKADRGSDKRDPFFLRAAIETIGDQ